MQWEEFVASAAAHQTTLSEAKLRAAFDFIDKDGDNLISKGADMAAASSLLPVPRLCTLCSRGHPDALSASVLPRLPCPPRHICTLSDMF